MLLIASICSDCAQPVSWRAFFATMFAGFGVVAYYQVERERQKEEAVSQASTKSYGKAKLGGPYSLVDSNGLPVTDKTYEGTTRCWTCCYLTSTLH